MNPSVISRAPRAVREFFLLERAQRRAAVLTPAHLASVGTYRDAARRRISAARRLHGIPNDAPAALSLYRDAALLLTFAFLIARDDRVDVASLTPRAAVDELDRALAIDDVEVPSAFAPLRVVLVSSDPLVIDRFPPEQSLDMADAFDLSTRWLSTLVDTRAPRNVNGRRAARLTTAAALVAGITLSAASPKNVARDKPTRGTRPAWGTAPAGAVDGSNVGRFGYHSEEDDSPWLMIDLERPCKVATVKVFGRADCCFDQSIPLALEASDDGTTFRKIAERTTQFTQNDPWVVTPGPLVTRFVRLRTERRSVLVLSEVEVYGRPK